MGDRAGQTPIRPEPEPRAKPEAATAKLNLKFGLNPIHTLISPSQTRVAC